MPSSDTKTLQTCHGPVMALAGDRYMLCIPDERNTVVQDMKPIDPDNWVSPVAAP